MRVFTAFFVCLAGLFGASVAFAQTVAAPKAPMNLGFYKASAQEIPAVVKARQSLIYRLDADYYAEIEASAYQDVLAIPALSEAGKKDIQVCIAAKTASCWIHFGQIRGSAFLDEDGRSIWTNCHIIHEWVEYRKQALSMQGVAEADLFKGIKASSVPFALFDSATGKLIIDTAQENSPSLLKAAVFSSTKTKNLECSMAADDAVKIELPRALAAHGIPRAKRPALTPLMPLYAGGHPKPTKDRQVFGRADSSGTDFYWTTGPYLAKGHDFDSYFGANNPYNLAFADDAESMLGDGVEGMSGGAVLNSNGELVGIFKGILPYSKQYQDVPISSVFISTEGLRFIEIYSEGVF